MSGNPFRRSSLKDPSAGTSHPESSPSSSTNVFLSIDTGARTIASTKRVAFRSPPALPLSPDSPITSPLSPVTTRVLAGQEPSISISEQSRTFGETYPLNPLQTDNSGDEDGTAFEEAKANTENNYTLTSSTDVSNARPHQDSVKTTLDRFASRPKTAAGDGPGTDAEPAETSAASKPAMDVIAFTHMLLSGGSTSTNSTEPSSVPVPTASECSSSADTASISQQSMFEPLSATQADTPRTSQELDRHDAASTRHSISSRPLSVARPKPLPPKPRHAKSRPAGSMPDSAAGLSQSTANGLSTADEARPHPVNESSRAPSQDMHSSGPKSRAADQPSNRASMDVLKRPPTPPLSRRRSSQKQMPRPELVRNNSMKSSQSSQPRPLEPSSSQSFHPSPPPPPTRRPAHDLNPRSSATYVESTPLSSGLLADSAGPMVESTPARPPLVPSRSSLSSQKRHSQHAPAPPPPRRPRGSSKTSADMAYPPSTILPISGTDSGQASTGVLSDGSVLELSGDSNAKDILADLARLQAEVDAMRAPRRENG